MEQSDQPVDLVASSTPLLLVELLQMCQTADGCTCKSWFPSWVHASGLCWRHPFKMGRWAVPHLIFQASKFPVVPLNREPVGILCQDLRVYFSSY